MNNENDIFSKIVEKAKQTTLTEREKRTLFLAVDTYVENNPVYIKESAEAGVKAGSTAPKFLNKPIRSEGSIQTRFQTFISSWHIHSFQTVIAVFVIMIFGVGGSSIAAQNSLPGNILYPIKVNINEGLKSVFLSGPAKASFEVERAKTRVEEAKQLVAENKMTDKIQNEIANQLNVHVTQVQKDVNTLAAKGDLKSAFEVSNNLETSLEQTSVSVSASTPSSQADISNSGVASLQNIIQAPLQASTVARETTEEKISSLQTNDESTRLIAEAKLEAAKKLIQSVNDRVSLSGSVVIQPVTTSAISSSAPIKTSKIATTTTVDELTRAQNLITRGQEKMDSQQYSEAFTLFKQAYDLSQSLQFKTDLENGASQIHNEIDNLLTN